MAVLSWTGSEWKMVPLRRALPQTPKELAWLLRYLLWDYQAHLGETIPPHLRGPRLATTFQIGDMTISVQASAALAAQEEE